MRVLGKIYNKKFDRIINIDSKNKNNSFLLYYTIKLNILL